MSACSFSMALGHDELSNKSLESGDLDSRAARHINHLMINELTNHD